MLFFVFYIWIGRKKAIDNVTTHYKSLARSLPIDNLLPDLYSKKVINSDEKEAIEKKQLKREKVSILIDQVIKPELEAGIFTKFDNFIKVLDDSDDSTAKRLSDLLNGTYTYVIKRYNNRIIIM